MPRKTTSEKGCLRKLLRSMNLLNVNVIVDWKNAFNPSTAVLAYIFFEVSQHAPSSTKESSTFTVIFSSDGSRITKNIARSWSSISISVVCMINTFFRGATNSTRDWYRCFHAARSLLIECRSHSMRICILQTPCQSNRNFVQCLILWWIKTFFTNSSSNFLFFLQR